MKVLLVEDEVALNRSLTKLLKKQEFVVDSAFDGLEAWDYVQLASYDILVLDVMMPEMDGFSLLEKLRQKRVDVPVLFLTARDALEDRVHGLEMGADDYLIKPFEVDELVARMKAIVRRHRKEMFSEEVEVAAIRIDFQAKRVFLDHQEVVLTGKEYQLLEYLVRHLDQYVTRDQIRNKLWDMDYEGESNIIDVLIRNLRRKLGADLIETKRGVGYVIRKK